MSDSTIIQIGVPVRFEWKNFRRGYSDRRGGIGAVYKIEVEVNAEDWATLETMPRAADGEMVMWVTEIGSDNGDKAKKAKEVTPHGALWRELFLVGFINCPGIREAVNNLPKSGYEKPRDLLRQLFGVKSLSREIGEDKIFAQFPEIEYPQVKVMVEQAKRKAEKNG